MKILFLFSLVLISLSVAAQTETAIRNHYNEVNTKIKESVEQGFEGPLYQNQLVKNKNSKSWPAVGIYTDTINYWYTEDPGQWKVQGKNPKSNLLKVATSSRHGADVWVSEEYLFKDGRLMFYYQWWAEEANVWEKRVYYNLKEVAFKTVVKVNDIELTAKDFLNPDYKDLKPKPTAILAEAQRLQSAFLQSL